MKNKPLTFDQYFSQIYDNWEDLKQNLLKDHAYSALDFKNKKSELIPIGEKVESEDCYFLDPVSTKTIDLLNPSASDIYYDFCASPGGKTLYFCHQYLNSENVDKVKMTVNEYNKNRLIKLKNNFKQFVPQLYDQIRLTNYDGRLWFKYEVEVADKIILDVPCSSERHLLKQHATESWSFKKMKNLTNTQLSLLCSAFEVLRPGGELVYSTCSINPLENEDILNRFAKKRAERFELSHSELILPSEENHFGGPIFMAKLVKFR